MKHLLLILALLFCSCENNEDNIVNPEYGEGDEYEIYKTVIESSFNAKGGIIILDDSTTKDLVYNSSLYERTPGLLAETAINYDEINKTKVKIKKIQGIDFIVFRTEYTGNEAILTLQISRVGFDSQKTQAIVTVAAIRGPRAARGHLFFVIKEKDKWIIKNTSRLWIS